MEFSKHCERQKVLSRQILRSFFEMSWRLVLSDGSRTKEREPGQSVWTGQAAATRSGMNE